MSDIPAVKTRLVPIDPEHPDAQALADAAAVLRSGGLVAFPTETVYGLGAHALDPAAVRRIFAAKRRPAFDPLIVHIAPTDALEPLAEEVPPLARTLMGAFWPGPLTLVLRRSPRVPDEVTAGGPTVALRAPDHPLAQALIAAAGIPIAAPSANLFGHTSPTTARHVWDDLAGRIDLILDGGPTPIGVESTVLDVSGARPLLLRPGGIPREAIEALIGRVLLREDVESPARDGGAQDGPALASPGLLDRHYAPHTPLLLLCGDQARALAALRALAEDEIAAGRWPALLVFDEDREYLSGLPCPQVALGPLSELASVAQRLYAALREADSLRADHILAREVPAGGLGAAIRDRMRRAARQRIDVP